MPPESYWEFKQYFNCPDLCIIGAGLVGLNAGISYLELNPDAKVLILERSYISSGASSKNAGFACFGSPTELMADLQKLPADKVFELFNKRYSGIQSLLIKVKPQKISYEKAGGFEVFTDNVIEPLADQSDLNRLNAHIEEYSGIKNYFYVDNDRLKIFELKGFNTLIANDHEALLNPVQVLEELKSKFISLGGKILFGININSWTEQENEIIITASESLTINCYSLLICINGFAKNFFPELDVYPARNLVMVLKPEKKLNIKGCFHANRGYVYFREIDGNLLIGGGRHVDEFNENTDQSGTNPTIEKYLLDFACRHILDSDKYKIEYQWSGIMGLGNTKQPIIKMTGTRTGIAVRLGGMGVALSSLVGEEAAVMMNKK